MKRTAGELAAFLGGRLEGRSEQPIESLADLGTAGEQDLSYAEPRLSDQVASSSASCILVSEGEFPTQTTIVVRNPKAAFARAAVWLNPPEPLVAGVHPTAVIGDSVQLSDVTVSAHVVIDDDVVVGPSTIVHPGCYIARGCRIGSGCVIHANVVLYAGVELGNRVIVHAGTVIGSDGFGYVRDGKEFVKFPQIGRLIIEDDVEIGANSTIDRGSLGTTVIKRGTKLDNLCHVAHNVSIGVRTVIAAQTGISGSSEIGSDAVIAGQVGIGDHVRIGDGSVIGGQCGILRGKRIQKGEVFWGTPARPLKVIKVQQAYIARLPKMARELKRLRREVEQMREIPGTDT